MARALCAEDLQLLSIEFQRTARGVCPICHRQFGALVVSVNPSTRTRFGGLEECKKFIQKNARNSGHIQRPYQAEDGVCGMALNWREDVA